MPINSPQLSLLDPPQVPQVGATADLRPPTSVPNPRLAYILGASHSGSTLLAMLLGAHPEACATGELKATSMGDPDQYRCSCKLPIRQCSFWAKVSKAIARRGLPGFDITAARTSIFEVDSPYAQRLLLPLQRGSVLERVRDFALFFCPTWRAHLPETQRRNLALIESLLGVTGAKVVVDSSKLALRLKYLLQIPALDIKVIRIIRDGRAVSLTYTNEWNFADSSDPALRGGGTGARHEAPRRNMAEAAREWRRSNEAADCLVAGLPRSKWVDLRYEELCRNPGSTLRRLCGFLGLDPAKISLDFRSRPHHVIGNGMRLDNSSEIKLDERWKNHLTADDLTMFDRVAGKLNRKYGYV